MSSLYELRTEFMDLQNLLDSAEDDEFAQAVRDTLDGKSGDLEEAVEQSVRLVRNIESDAAAVQAEIDRLKQRKDGMDRRVASIRDGIRALMDVAGEGSIKTALFTVSLAKGRESVSVVDESLLPDEYVNVKTSITPNKKLIGEALKNGGDVPGCELIRGEKSLRIK
jgi:hypothetical protein